MTPERWERIQELYHSARACSAGERASFLDAACAADRALQREVQALLDQPVSTGSFVEFLGGPPRAHVEIDASANLTGRRLGSYQVLSLLGKGGMGEVYRAHDAKLGRDVAIKVLPAMFTADADRLARFASEARMLAALNHPHIGAIYGLEDADRVPALVLELVEGDTLADRLRRGPIPPREAFAMARQIADALHAAHRKGIIHRDLKPANIKITPEGVVKVLDFGLAKAAATHVGSTHHVSQSETAALGTTRVGVILGTAAYMSPEQARGLSVDARSDIWAFGCVLYEMLTGRPPFTAQTVAETLAAIMEREPEWKALPSATPASVRELLRACLEKDLALRLPNIAEARSTIDEAQRGWNRWRVAAMAAVGIAAVTIGSAVWWREPVRPADRSDWIQLTNLSDSVTHPALSPDGRMVAFIRGSSNSVVPFVAGQVFVKVLPSGEPVQLTNDTTFKMSPVFSPDGSRIAYTSVNQNFQWDTWTVPVLGGEPRPWLLNASGLAWSGPGNVLFSEMKKNPHMGIVAAEESRINQRDVYVPAHAQGMAHLSYASPDGKWILLVEMDGNHVWMPCRVVSVDQKSPGRLVGPARAGCTFGAWSPDSKWVYLTSNAGGTNHIWRQRFPDGKPEQITSGPTEEEGVTMAPDGRWFVTAVALRSASLWLHTAEGERQVSVEGNAIDAKFTADGTKLLYKAVSYLGDYPLPGEVRVADVQTGRSEALISGFQILDYDVAPNGQEVVLEAADRDGISRLWVAALDRQSAPRQIPGVEGQQPRFGPGGEIFFRRPAGSADANAGPDGTRATFVYRVRPDGTGIQKAIEQPIPLLGEVSPDGNWITGWTSHPDNGTSGWQAFPLNGGPSILLGNTISWEWSPRGDSISLSGQPIAEGRTYLIPLRPGEVFPAVPAEGFHAEREVAALPGARKMDADAVPGPSTEVYAFYRKTTQRNLYRIPIR